MSAPAPKEVRDMFENLLGRSIEVGLADPIQSGELRRTLVAVYRDDGGKLSGVAGMELPLAVYAGAALGLIPPGGAHDSVEEGVLSGYIAENATEVCNVMAGLLNRHTPRHLQLHQRFLPGEGPPTDATQMLLGYTQRLDLTVEVAGYGGGKLSLALLA